MAEGYTPTMEAGGCMEAMEGDGNEEMIEAGASRELTEVVEPNGVKAVTIPIEDLMKQMKTSHESDLMAARNSEPEVIICPYDKNHRVPRPKMYDHLRNCRDAYQLKMHKKGEAIVLMSCKYNHEHEVNPPELAYHEARCEDGRYTPWYLRGESGPTEEDYKRMYDGCYIDKFLGGWKPSFDPVPVAVLGDPGKHAEFAHASVAAGLKKEQEQKLLEKPDHGTFDYTQSLLNPKRPMGHLFPPGLDWSQRRKFEVWTMEWIENIRSYQQALREQELAEDEDEESIN